MLPRNVKNYVLRLKSSSQQSCNYYQGVSCDVNEADKDHAVQSTALLVRFEQLLR